MSNLIVKLKSSKIVNSGIIKKIKDKIYYSYISPREEKKTDKYRREIIEKVARIFEGKHWILSSGSFLRYYRDNTMDGQDLDFNIIESDFENVKDKFFEEGFLLKQVFLNNKGQVTEYKFLYKNVEIDVFINRKEKDYYIASFTLEAVNAKNISKKVVGNTQIISGKDYISYARINREFKAISDYDYKGITFKGPKNAEKAIVEWYGEGWKVYDPNYDCRTNPENNMPIPSENAKSIVYIKPIDHYEKI